jgi:hypothetical protein
MVMIAASVLVLFGFLAFAFDFGRMYVERRELQSGADAAALAVAGDCAAGMCGAGYDPYVPAEQYADANARDGFAWVRDIDLDLTAQRVTIHAATEDPGGDHFFDMAFAQLIGYQGLTVGANATAAWGSPRSLATLPLIFSMCEWNVFGESGYVDATAGGYLHRASSVEAGLLPPALGYLYADRVAKVFFHGTDECYHEASGQDLPGGFGWLETPKASCEAELVEGAWVAADPGASPSTGCSSSVMVNLVGKVVLLPYFEGFRSVGGNAEYEVAGFGAFYITGYNFGGQYKESSIVFGTLPCKGEDRCIEGYVIADWIATGGDIGGADLGVVVIQLVG